MSTTSPSVPIRRRGLTTSDLAHEAPAGKTRGWWGMFLLIASEAATFAGFFGAYFYLRFRDYATFPPPGISQPKLFWPWCISAATVVAMVALFMADRSSRSTGISVTPWLSIGLLAGAAAFSLDVMEIRTELKSFHPTGSAYGSLFYAIHGLDAAHVAAGILLLTFLLLVSATGRLTVPRLFWVQLVALWWYFVFVVWTALMLILYGSPRL